MSKINLSNPRLLIALVLMLVIGSAVIAGVYYNVSDASELSVTTLQQAPVTSSPVIVESSAPTSESISEPVPPPPSEPETAPVTSSSTETTTTTSTDGQAPSTSGDSTVNKTGGQSTTRDLPGPENPPVPNPIPTSSSKIDSTKGIKGNIGNIKANKVLLEKHQLDPEAAASQLAEGEARRQEQIRDLVYRVTFDEFGGATGRRILTVLLPYVNNDEMSVDSVERLIEVAERSIRRPSLKDTALLEYLYLSAIHSIVNTFVVR